MLVGHGRYEQHAVTFYNKHGLVIVVDFTATLANSHMPTIADLLNDGKRVDVTDA